MNIAYLTSEYKDISLGNKDKFTSISNTFAKEWVKQGHNVIVIHNASCFPKFIYMIPDNVKGYFENKFGFMWGSYDSVKYKEYVQDDVQIFRIPIKKYIPHRSPSKSSIKSQVSVIRQIFTENNFTPDVIIGQWISPQMEIIYNLKDVYKCKTSVVLHGNGYYNEKKFPIEKYLTKIDKLGVRSAYHAKEVKDALHLDYEPFICYSGIPDDYLSHYSINTNKFDKLDKWKFIFVGRLIEYKKVDSVIKALSKINNIDWELNILGEGDQENYLKRLTKDLQCEKKVNFLGKVSRNEVMKKMSESHCFIMVSEGEVFGLVYLEALGASCITVASKDGGIDGIIRNGDNGFLSNQGDEKNLFETINKIVNMDIDKIKEISSNAYDTAVKLKDSEVARKYLELVLEK